MHHHIQYKAKAKTQKEKASSSNIFFQFTSYLASSSPLGRCQERRAQNTAFCTVHLSVSPERRNQPALLEYIHRYRHQREGNNQLVMHELKMKWKLNQFIVISGLPRGITSVLSHYYGSRQRNAFMPILILHVSVQLELYVSARCTDWWSKSQ